MSVIQACFEIFPELRGSYSNPAVVYGVFRHLPPGSQEIIMALLFLANGIERSNFERLIPNPPQKDLDALYKKGILQQDGHVVRLHPDFCGEVKAALVRAVPCSLRTKSKPDRRQPTQDQIVQRCSDNWNALINYLIDFAEVPSGPVLDLLLRAKLVYRARDSIKPTANCFKFLLKPTDFQLKYLIRQLIAESRDRVRTVMFLYNLSVGEFCRDYYAKGIDEPLLTTLVDVGLLFKNPRSKRFYLSPNMLGLMTNTPQPNPNTEKFMLIENNFRVYAYTSSRLHIELLSYFLELTYRLPNLVIGNISRTNIIQAYKKGLNADLIINFMVNHVRSPVPENVIDQIMLWEKERERLRSYESIMLQDFIDMSLYNTTLGHAKSTGAHIWNCPERRVIILLKAKAEPVIRELKNLDRS